MYYDLEDMDKLRKRYKRSRKVKRIVLRLLAVMVLAAFAGVAMAIVCAVVEPREVLAAESERTLPTVRTLTIVTAAEMAGVPAETAQVLATAEAPEKAAVPGRECLGTFVLTAYCNCRTCCGKWSGGPTYSGVMPREGRTIAVDPRVIPLGTHVYIDGYGEYVAEDTGSSIKGNRIDIYMGSHTAARCFSSGAGSCRRKVWILDREDSE